MFRLNAVWLLAVALILTAGPASAAPAKAEAVRIDGYDGEAMEPFLSRDGRFLFFNTRNDPGVNTNIHFAEAGSDGIFAHRGVLEGTVSYDLDGTPTMSAKGLFCFVSPRDYRRTRVSVFCGVFTQGRVERVAPQPGLASERLGLLIFDTEVSADGRTMIFAEGEFTGGQVPNAADLHFATWTKDGYQRAPQNDAMLANVNTSALEYAPSLSADGLELFFTRLTGIWPFSSPTIFRATRTNTTEPFGKPVELKIRGFVEGPSVAADGVLYFHKRVSGRYQIWRQPR